MFTGFLLVLVPAQLDSAGACSLLGLKSCTDRYTPQPYPHLPDVRALDPVATSPFSPLFMKKPGPEG